MNNGQSYCDLLSRISGKPIGTVSDEEVAVIDRVLVRLGYGGTARLYAEVFSRVFGLNGKKLGEQRTADLFGVSKTAVHNQISRGLRRLQNDSEIRRIISLEEKVISPAILPGDPVVLEEVFRRIGALFRGADSLINQGIALAEKFPERETVILSLAGVLCRRIEEFPFSSRTLNVLRLNGLTRLGDVIQKTERELLMLKNFGRRQLEEIRNVLSMLNLTLKTKVG